MYWIFYVIWLSTAQIIKHRIGIIVMEMMASVYYLRDSLRKSRWLRGANCSALSRLHSGMGSIAYTDGQY
jgi:hypothetical protein